MPFIYETSGKAKEYCPLAVNIYKGCDHGCSYCYGPAILRSTREGFKAVQRRPGLIKGLCKEAAQYAGREVLLCFMTDPYCHFAMTNIDVRETIAVLLDRDVQVRILTKGGYRSRRDFDILKTSNRPVHYGTTLTFLDEKQSLEWEPNAAIPSERLAMLEEAKNAGFKTWVSCEPVIQPEQTLRLIELAAPFVDEFKVGRWNHDSRANAIDWKAFGHSAVKLLEKLGKKYYIKEDLRKAM